VTAIGTSTGNPFSHESLGNLAYASNGGMDVGVRDNNPTGVSNGNDDKLKAEFAYEMAQITGKILSSPTTNVESFKIEFAYATAKVTAKVMLMIPSFQRNEFAYEMAQITTKIISSENLDIEKAKAEFAYEVAQLTTKIITNTDLIANNTAPKAMLSRNNGDSESKAVLRGNNTDNIPQAILLRNNADIETKVENKVNNTANTPKIIATTYVSPETYTSLVDELDHVGDRSKHTDNKVKIDGEVRYHYALNSGASQWAKNSSGIRTRIGFDAGINQDWRAYGMLESQTNIMNYNNEFKLSHFYVGGKLGGAVVTAGSFGYLMAEGNIYDSAFKGVKVDYVGPLKYTFAYGDTDYTKKTYIATARYNDFDYSLEAGIHHYQKDDGSGKENTIRTLSGNYNFSNFGVGIMALQSSLKDRNGDSNGYVFSLNYGDLKTFRPGTYNVFAKYYNQPLNTYIAHGMNGKGSLMNGFKGYGLGAGYTFATNSVVGIEYYGLTDKISGEKGNTWWTYVTHYF